MDLSYAVPPTTLAGHLASTTLHSTDARDGQGSRVGAAGVAGGTCPRSLRPMRKSKSYAANLRDLVAAGVGELLALGGGGMSGKPTHETPPSPKTLYRDVQFERNVRKGRILRATNYAEFAAASSELDALEDAEAWKADDASDLYDAALLRSTVAEMRNALQSRDVERVLAALQAYTARRFAGLDHPALYSRVRQGTKNLIEKYVTLVQQMVEFTVQAPGTETVEEAEKKLNRMRNIKRQRGRTALLLSGGGTLGMNHVGVIKALHEADLLPHVVSGTSAGSIVASVLCTRSEAEIPTALQGFCHGDLACFVGPHEERGPLARVKYFLANRHLYDPANLSRVLLPWLGDVTFAEAYERSRRVLNIVVSTTAGSHGPLLLNVYSTPHVIVRSAVLASCSVPYLFPTARLEFKNPVTGEVGLFRDEERYMDGSLQGDVPMQDVSDQLGCDAFIVSQVNPHVRPWIRPSDRPSTSNLPSRLLSTATTYLWEEASHHITPFLPTPPARLSKVIHILEQPYIGDITILPTIEHQRVIGVLRNPTPEFMEFALLNGERATWQKMNHIRFALSIERAFERAEEALRARWESLRGAGEVRNGNLWLKLPPNPLSTPSGPIPCTIPENLRTHNVRTTTTATHKSISLPCTPTPAPQKSFFETSAPSTPVRTRSPASSLPRPSSSTSVDLTMTPTPSPPKGSTAQSTTEQSHRRVQSDLTLSVSVTSLSSLCEEWGAGRVGGGKRNESPSISRRHSRGRGRGRRAREGSLSGHREGSWVSAS